MSPELVDPSPIGTALAVAALLYMGHLVERSRYRRNARRKAAAAARAAAMERHPSNRSHAKCDSTGCNYDATETHIMPADVHGLRPVRVVCTGCANEGDKFGWWEDLDVWAEARDGIPAVEDYANGGAA